MGQNVSGGKKNTNLNEIQIYNERVAQDKESLERKIDS